MQHIFEKPTRCDVKWSDVESLFKALDGEVRDGRGARIRVTVGERDLNLHKPHKKDMKKSAVDLVRDFLVLLGVKP